MSNDISKVLYDDKESLLAEIKRLEKANQEQGKAVHFIVSSFHQDVREMREQMSRMTQQMTRYAHEQQEHTRCIDIYMAKRLDDHVKRGTQRIESVSDKQAAAHLHEYAQRLNTKRWYQFWIKE